MKQRKSLWQLGILLCLCFLVIGCNQVPEGERISLVEIMQTEETAPMIDMDAAAEKIISIDKYKAV